MAPFVLKFKGNRSFVAFQSMGDTEALTKTWKVCTKVASHLEQGARLENLSWRLWHLHNVLVESDNAKSKREFKKLSKTMGDKLDKEKGRSIEELHAPGFKPTPAQEKIRQRAEEKERAREAVVNGTVAPKAHYKYTFSVEPQTPPTPSATTTSSTTASERRPSFKSSSSRLSSLPFTPARSTEHAPSVKFPAVFDNSFEPAALLYSASSATAPSARSYGEGVNERAAAFGVVRPTFELVIDELLADSATPEPGMATMIQHEHHHHQDPFEALQQQQQQQQQQDMVVDVHNLGAGEGSSSSGTPPPATASTDPLDYPPFYIAHNGPYEAFSPGTLGLAWHNDGYMDPQSLNASAQLDAQSYVTASPAPPQPHALASPVSVASEHKDGQSVSPPPAPLPSPEIPLAQMPPPPPPMSASASASLSRRTSNAGSAGAAATPTATPRGAAPIDGKTECSNCGATHTPLWRRGLNDELNCNACGLYCNLHKRPRPKNFRSQDGSRAGGSGARFGGAGDEGPSEPVSCYNCHTTTTPLWRKDEEGKTVCNACGLYSKLHGAARPMSMKSESIRKRARHDAVPGTRARAASASMRRRRSPTPPTPPVSQQQVAQMQMPAVASPPHVQAHDVAETYNGVLDAQGNINLDLDDVMGLGDDLANLGMHVTQEHHYAVAHEPLHVQQQPHPTFGAWDQPTQTSFPGPYHPDELSGFVTVASPTSNKRRRLSMDAYVGATATAGWPSAGSAGGGVPFPQSYLYGHTFHPPLVGTGVPESPVMHPPLQLPGGEPDALQFWDETMWLRS